MTTDANEKARNLLTLTRRFCEILAQENAALEAHRPGDLAATVEEKDKLSRAYEALVRGMIQDEVDEDAIEPATREHLRAYTERMHGLMAENARALKVGIVSAERLMGAIAEAVNEATPTSGAYNRVGVTGPAARRRGAEVPSVSLDQTL